MFHLQNVISALGNQHEFSQAVSLYKDLLTKCFECHVQVAGQAVAHKGAPKVQL